MRKLFFIIIGFLLTLSVYHISIATESQTTEPSVLVLGDSLSAAFGVKLKNGWVSLLQNKLKQSGYTYKVINASISGDTTDSGVSRLPRALKNNKPSIVIIELGGNDGLRGHTIKKITDNLSTLIELCHKHNSKVLLLGMRMPENYGALYTKKFHEIYINLAKQYQIALVPFFLENIATNEDLMQEDGIHPRDEAQALMLDNVWLHLVPLLKNNVGKTAQ